MGDENQKYTVDEALLAVGFGYFQVIILLYAGVGWVSEAMEMMLLSFIGPAVQSAWGLSSHEESLLTSVVFAGMLVGAYSWGSVSDIYGRRWDDLLFDYVSNFLYLACIGWFSNYSSIRCLTICVNFELLDESSYLINMRCVTSSNVFIHSVQNLLYDLPR